MKTENMGEILRLEPQTELLIKGRSSKQKDKEQHVKLHPDVAEALLSLQKMGVKLTMVEIVNLIAENIDREFWNRFVEVNTPFHIRLQEGLKDPEIRRELHAGLVGF